MFRRSLTKSGLFKKYGSHTLSFLGGVITLWGFSLTLTNTIPTINLESIVVSKGKNVSNFRE